MTIFLKSVIFLASLAGIGTSVSLPLVMKSEKTSTAPLVNSREGGADVNQISSPSITIKRCSDEIIDQGVPITFGEQETNKMCWKIESGDNQLRKEVEYSSLFEDRWGRGNQDWNMSNNQNQWTQQCFEIQGTQFPWAILISSDNGEQYLGLCGQSEVNSTKFIRKRKEVDGESKQEKLTFSVCDSDCWDIEQQEVTDDKIQKLTQEKENNWKKVLFYRS